MKFRRYNANVVIEKETIKTINVTHPLSDGSGIYCLFCCYGKGGNNMPETKGESLVFTALTAWIMVYGMTLYNIVLATGMDLPEIFCRST